MRGRRTALLALALALGGCATLPPPQVEHDTLSGRLAVRVEAHQAEPARHMNAAFELRGDSRRGELDLTSPIGTTLARARWSPARAELLTPDGRESFPDLEALARQTFGEPLPLAALFDWLRGRPWPGAPSERTPQGFEQLGWMVDLQRRAEGWVVASRAAPPAVTVRARMDGP